MNLLAAAAAWPFAAGAQPAPPSPVCGTIGVQVHPMTTAFAQSLGMTEPYGAIFGRPRPGSAAAKAGIERYDVVTAIDGVPLRSWRDFAHHCTDGAANGRLSHHPAEPAVDASACDRWFGQLLRQRHQWPLIAPVAGYWFFLKTAETGR
jgi:hypothetical protein